MMNLLHMKRVQMGGFFAFVLQSRETACGMTKLLCMTHFHFLSTV